jgi:hypothetical protein
MTEHIMEMNEKLHQQQAAMKQAAEQPRKGKSDGGSAPLGALARLSSRGRKDKGGNQLREEDPHETPRGYSNP